MIAGVWRGRGRRGAVGAGLPAVAELEQALNEAGQQQAEGVG